MNNRRGKVNSGQNNKRNNITEEEDDAIEVIEGRVMDALPNTHFKVDTKNGQFIAYLGGRMRVHKIRILVGDKVSLQLDEYGGKARIVRRL